MATKIIQTQIGKTIIETPIEVEEPTTKPKRGRPSKQTKAEEEPDKTEAPPAE